MAHCIPNELPNSFRKEPYRNAEICFYDNAKSLPHEWFVLYGVTWFCKINEYKWNEGEADFVIIGPEIGIVIVEIKGGHIGRNNDGWYSVDRNKRLHIIKDPILQAARNKHNIFDYLSKDLNIRKNIFKHMVCFPDIKSDDLPNLIECPQEMCICSDDLTSLEQKFKQYGKVEYPLTYNECFQIANKLKPNFDCPNKLSLTATRQLKIINELTDEQTKIYDLVKSNAKLALTGPAGSGKTLIALKAAYDFIQQNKKVLVILPGGDLKTYYSTILNSPRCLCINKDYFFNNSNSLISLFKPNLIIIDEAQDIDPLSWDNLNKNINFNMAEKIIIIYDSNQKLSKLNNIDLCKNMFKISLNTVIRNTRQIAECSSKFHSNPEGIIIKGPEGLDVSYISCNDFNEINNQIEKIINKCIAEDFDYRDITVLFCDHNRRRIILPFNDKNKSGITLTLNNEGSKFKNPLVNATTVFKFRGLENNIIILTGLEDIDSQQLNSACYIGMTRARCLLYIIGTHTTIEKIKKYKP